MADFLSMMLILMFGNVSVLILMFGKLPSGVVVTKCDPVTKFRQKPFTTRSAYLAFKSVSNINVAT